MPQHFAVPVVATETVDATKQSKLLFGTIWVVGLGVERHAALMGVGMVIEEC
jgi:hypothetical protein